MLTQHPRMPTIVREHDLLLVHALNDLMQGSGPARAFPAKLQLDRPVSHRRAHDLYQLCRHRRLAGTAMPIKRR
jgi:hypothetical protein